MDRNITISYWSVIYPSLDIIRDQIRINKTPVFFENIFDNPNNPSQTVHHDVVVYGYTNDNRLIVHFGWKNKSHIVCYANALLLWESSACAIAYH